MRFRWALSWYKITLICFIRMCFVVVVRLHTLVFCHRNYVFVLLLETEVNVVMRKLKRLPSNTLVLRLLNWRGRLSHSIILVGDRCPVFQADKRPRASMAKSKQFLLHFVGNDATKIYKNIKQAK